MSQPKTYLEEFQDRLQKARNDKGFTQKQVAEYLGISVNTYQRIETGDRPMDLMELRKLGDLGFDTEWLQHGRSVGNLSPQQTRRPTDSELMARIMDGLVVLYREENQRLVPLDQGRMAAQLYDELAGIEDEAERRGALRYALEMRRKEMRQPVTAATPSKHQA